MSNLFAETLRKKGWIHIPFPFEKLEFFKAADFFLDFCSLPLEEKQHLHRFPYPNDRVSQVGYFQRRQETGAFDDKEVWHHHIHIKDILGTEPLWQHQKTRAFVAAADALLKKGIEVLTDILNDFEKEYPEIRDRFLPQGKAPKIYLRFVNYAPQKTGAFLAKGHFDRGGLTIALCESAPGLRLGKDASSLTPLTHQENMGVFFPGISFPEVTDNRFTPIWHDVIQKSEDHYRSDCARWAIVLFADAFDMVPPTVAQARKFLM